MSILKIDVRILCILIFNMAHLSFAQHITGTIVDIDSKPIMNANVVLKSSTDNKYLKGVSSDQSGTFILSYNTHEDYLLEVTFLGCDTVYIQISNSQENIDLGIIKLKESAVLLDEVEVKAAQRINKIDRQIIFPDKLQLKLSSSGYDLLKKLALPGIKVDEVHRTITSIGGVGSVQIRINDIEVSESDIVSLRPDEVVRIDYIENPGVRYGDNVGMVINFVMLRRESGVVTGINLLNAVTTGFGSDNVFIKYNHKKSEFGLNYAFDYKAFSQHAVDEDMYYLMPDNSGYMIHRDGLNSSLNNRAHKLQLKYSLYESDKYVLSAVLRGTFQDQPMNENNQSVSESRTDDYFVRNQTKEKLKSPALDVYYQRYLPHKQSVMVNMVGTYIDSEYGYLNSEYDKNSQSPLSTFGYSSDGKKYSLIGEAIYEKKFQHFNFSSGVQYSQNYLENSYSDDHSENITPMRQSNSYLYTQIKGNLKKLSYMVGMGISRQYSRQDSTGYTYWTFRPSLSMSYPVFKQASLTFQFEIRPNLPKLSNVSNVRLQRNEWEIITGNPDLKPFRNVIQKLVFVHQGSRTYTQLSGVYMSSKNAIMPTISRVVNPDGNTVFEYGAANQKSMNQLVGQAYVQYDLLPKKIALVGYGGVNRFFSNGNDYTRTYTSWFGGIQSTVYLENWTIAGNIDSRYRALFGETIWHNEYSNSVNVSYTLKNMQFALGWMFPFQTGQKSGEETRDKVVTKRTWNTTHNYGNMITLNFVWNFNWGRKYNSAKQLLNNSDTDSGVVKSNSM